MNFQMEHKPLDVFNFSSLADIVLQLLIFFLLTSAFMLQTGIKVQVPKAQSADAVQERKEIMVSVTKENQIFLNGNPTTVEKLSEEVKPLLVDKENQVILLKADKEVSLQNAVTVIDVIKAAGGTKFLIATEPEAQQPIQK
jgi:biopolymer transport protein ExbD